MKIEQTEGNWKLSRFINGFKSIKFVLYLWIEQTEGNWYTRIL